MHSFRKLVNRLQDNLISVLVLSRSTYVYESVRNRDRGYLPRVTVFARTYHCRLQRVLQSRSRHSGFAYSFKRRRDYNTNRTIVSHESDILSCNAHILLFGFLSFATNNDF